MNIAPINIKIEEDKKFGLLSFLVDRDDFLEDIANIRERLKILTFPYDLPDLPDEKAQNIVKAFRKNLLTIGQARGILQEVCSARGIFLADFDKTLAMAFVYAEAFMKKYHKSRLYLSAILASILIGTIQEYDFLSTYRLNLDLKTLDELSGELDSDEKLTAIVVNRESTINEVEDVFNSLKKYQFGTQKMGKNDPMVKFLEDELPQNKLQSTISNIKRDRKWYWMNKGGLGYQKIWEQSSKSERGSSKETIAKAMQQYKRILRVEI